MNETVNTTEDQNDYIKSTLNNHKNVRNDDLGVYFSRFYKVLLLHKWLFVTIFIVIVAIVFIYSTRQPRIFQSNYEVFYNESIREFIDDSNVPVIKSDFDKNYWLSAMKSNELLQMTVNNSGLTYSVNELKNMIQVSVVDKRKEDRVPIFQVSVSSKQQDHIPIILRAFIKSLNELLLENQVTNSARLVSYLNDQINQNNQKLNQIDLEIVHEGVVGSNSEIIDFDKIKTSLDDFRSDLLNARVNLASIISARKKTEYALKSLDGTIVNESAFSEPLKVQLMNLEVDLARALTKNKEDHPTVKQLRNNIQQIRVMLRDSLEQRLEIKSLIQNPLKSQLMSRLLELQISEVSEETRVNSLERVITEMEMKTLPNSVNKEQQQQLRNREMVFLTIKQLNDKLIEAQSTSHGSLSRFVFIDDPTSIFLANKSKLYYLIFAVLLGMLIASLVVFIYDLLDDRIMLVEDYDRFYKHSLLGVVRHYASDESNLIEPGVDYKNKAVSDIGTLIVNMRQIIRHNDIKTIVISSPDRQEGKSLVSLKLASAFALKKQKVLLVDLDFFSPKLSSKLFSELPKGLSDFIVDDEKIVNIVRKTEIDSLDFVCAGNAEGQKELFYNDKRMLEFVNWAKKNYDLVIFDTPAAMYIPDIVEFFEIMDSIMVIARLKRTTRKLLNRLFSVLVPYNSKYIGVILNDLRSKSDKYSNYSYGYGNYVDASKSKTEKNTKKSIPTMSVVFSSIALIIIFALAYYFLIPNKFASLNSNKDEMQNDQVPIKVDTVAYDFDTDAVDLDTLENAFINDSANFDTLNVY